VTALRVFLKTQKRFTHYRVSRGKDALCDQKGGGGETRDSKVLRGFFMAGTFFFKKPEGEREMERKGQILWLLLNIKSSLRKLGKGPYEERMTRRELTRVVGVDRKKREQEGPGSLYLSSRQKGRRAKAPTLKEKA